MDEKAFECIVCLGVCRDCINCTNCHQLLCQEHVKDLRHDRCPSCRASPFHFTENIALRRIIEQVLPQQRGNNERRPRRDEDNTDGNEPLSRRRATVQESTSVGPTENPGIRRTRRTRRASRQRLAAVGTAATTTTATSNSYRHEWEVPFFGLDDARLDHSISQYGSKTRRNHPYHNEYKKVPNDAHHHNMLVHVRGCTHPGCKSVWMGPWGHFIGGADGRKYFDLTCCRIGRRLNELIGWDYEDPRC